MLLEKKKKKKPMRVKLTSTFSSLGNTSEKMLAANLHHNYFLFLSTKQ